MAITTRPCALDSTPTVGRLDFLQKQVLPRQSSHSCKISAFGLHGKESSRPAFQLRMNKRVRLVHIRAASKSPKPPPKPATRTAIIASIVVPLLLAASAVGAGQLLLAKIAKDAMAEVEEFEKQMDFSRLLTDGKSEEERKMEKDEAVVKTNVSRTRNRPKREE